jgi:hypothetical protein
MAAPKPGRRRKQAAKSRAAKKREPESPPDYGDEVTKQHIDALNKAVSDDEFRDHKTISGPSW